MDLFIFDIRVTDICDYSLVFSMGFNDYFQTNQECVINIE
jgi:hypothetical protein